MKRSIAVHLLLAVVLVMGAGVGCKKRAKSPTTGLSQSIITRVQSVFDTGTTVTNATLADLPNIEFAPTSDLISFIGTVEFAGFDQAINLNLDSLKIGGLPLGLSVKSSQALHIKGDLKLEFIFGLDQQGKFYVDSPGIVASLALNSGDANQDGEIDLFDLSASLGPFTLGIDDGIIDLGATMRLGTGSRLDYSDPARPNHRPCRPRAAADRRGAIQREPAADSGRRFHRPERRGRGDPCFRPVHAADRQPQGLLHRARSGDRRARQAAGSEGCQPGSDPERADFCPRQHGAGRQHHLQEAACPEQTPEAFDGGPLALVRNGDRITIDARRRVLDVDVPAGDLKARSKTWRPRKPRYTKGVLAKYARLVSTASRGAVTD